MSARARQPSLLLHAGRFGAAVAARLAAQLGAGGDAPRGGPIAGALACHGATDEPEALREQLDALLGLPELFANASPTPRLITFAVVDLGEADAAAALQAALDRLVALVRRRYAALFADYRDDAQRGFLCNPILVLPAAGEPWPAAARALLAHLEALHRAPAAPPAVSNIFVVGESSARYLLPHAELVQMIAGFCELALCSELATDPALQRLLARSGDPFATFVCATAELDVAAARRYCATSAAIDLLDWLRRSSDHRANVADRAPELGELLDLRRYRELIPLEKGDRALDAVIESQCPSFDGAFRGVRLLEDGEETLAHYSAAWHRDCRRKLEAADRELGLFRVDEVIEEVEVNGAALLAEERERVDAFVDTKLADPAEGSVADAVGALTHLRKRLEAERAALREAATAPLAAAPDLARFDRAYEQCAAAVAAKPRRQRLLIWGALAWAVATVTVALALRKLAAPLGALPGSGLYQALHPPWAWLTAAAGSGVLIGALLCARLIAATKTIRRFVGHRERRGELLELLESLSRGPNGSLRAYYGSRFRRACDIWVYRTLLAALKHVADRLRRLEELQLLLEAHAEHARHELLVLAGPADGHFADGILHRSLVAADALPRVARERRIPRETADLVAAYCRAERPLARWKEALPLADLEAVLRSAEPFHRELLQTSVLLQPDLAPAARTRLRRFLGDFGQRLDYPLDFAGALFRDADDVERALGAAVVTGKPVAELVRGALEDAGAGRWQVHAVDEPGHRVLLLKLVTGIARAAIRWPDAPARGGASGAPSGAPPAETPPAGAPPADPGGAA